MYPEHTVTHPENIMDIGSCADYVSLLGDHIRTLGINADVLLSACKDLV